MKYFSLIYSGDIREGESAKVIPAQEFSTLLSAQEVLEEAKKDVALYLKKNKEACQKLLQQAEEAGFNKGLTQWNHHILFFEQKMRQFEHQLQQMVLPLALKAAKKIVGNLLDAHPEAIVEIVRGALKPVTQNKQVKIYVNKQDREELEKEKGKLKELLEQVQLFSIEDRDDVAVGGCIIETEAGIINASLANQWQALEAAFATFMGR